LNNNDEMAIIEKVQVLSSAPNLQTIPDHHKPHYTLILKEFSLLISLPFLSVMVPDCPFGVERHYWILTAIPAEFAS
jgi:hypothetical protein